MRTYICSSFEWPEFMCEDMQFCSLFFSDKEYNLTRKIRSSNFKEITNITVVSRCFRFRATTISMVEVNIT
jgi:hypothetical protein